jgi:hypothetical protein
MPDLPAVAPRQAIDEIVRDSISRLDTTKTQEGMLPPEGMHGVGNQM